MSVIDIGYTQLHSEYTTSTAEYDVYEGNVYTHMFIQLNIVLLNLMFTVSA